MDSIDDVARRQILALASLTCSLYILLRGMDIYMPMSVGVFLRAVPLVFLSFVAAMINQVKTHAKGLKLSKALGRGIILCAFGDVLSRLNYGSAPTVLYIGAHLCFMYAFSPQGFKQVQISKGMLGITVYLLIFGVVWSIVALAYSIVSPSIPSDMKMPLTAMFAIVGMILTRALTHDDIDAPIENLVYLAIGSIALALFDFLAVYHRLVQPIAHYELAAQLVYYIAHVCFAASTIFRKQETGASKKQDGKSATGSKSGESSKQKISQRKTKSKK